MPGRRTKKKGTTTLKRIDYSDIPPSTDRELKSAQRVGRPKKAIVKQLIAIRLDPQLLAKLRRLAHEQNTPYQSLIQDILIKAVNKAG